MTATPISVQVALSSSAVRISTPINAPSYKVVNLSSASTGTVWLSNDPGVRGGAAGGGIPLYPGTAVTRTEPELFAALDPTATAAVSLIIDPHTTEWENPGAIALALLNSGTILIDSPVQLASSGFNGNTSYQVGPINVATYQSISLQVTHQAIPAHTLTVTLNWFDSVTNIVIAVDTFSWTTGDTLPLMRSLPCRGSTLQVVVQQNPAASGAGDSIYIMGSHRPYIADMSIPSSIPAGPNSAPSVAADRVLVLTGDTVIVPGVGPTIFPSVRYDGPAMVYARIATAGVTGIFNIFDPTSGVQMFRWEIIAPAAAANDRTVAMVLPRRSWAVRFDNATAGNITMSSTILACPEGV